MAPGSGTRCACTSEIAQAALRDRSAGVRAAALAHVVARRASSSQPTASCTASIEAEFGFRLGRDVVPVDGGHTPTRSPTTSTPSSRRSRSSTTGTSRGRSARCRSPPTTRSTAGGCTVSRSTTGATSTSRRPASTVQRNGDVVTTGSGAAVLGHPLDGHGVARGRAPPVRLAGCGPATSSRPVSPPTCSRPMPATPRRRLRRCRVGRVSFA